MLNQFDAQLRGRLSVHPPYGAVVERDGPLIRTHYGTHGTVDHRPLRSADGLDELIVRQQEAFAARGEPGEWKVYHYDPVPLGDRLAAAGFVRGWRRTVLAAPFSQLRPAGMISQPVGHAELDEVAELAARSGPHRLPFGEFLANGGHFGGERSDIRVIKARGHPIRAAAWAEYAGDFISIGGVADPRLESVLRLCAWHPDWHRNSPRYVVVEADGELRTALQDVGLRPITTATTYHWTLPAPPAQTRPVTPLFGDTANHEIWDRFITTFDFQPSIKNFPGITEPTPSVAWRLDAIGHDAADILDGIVRDGLVACVPPGESLYWLDWMHLGWRFDPHQVGRPDRPDWPGYVIPDGDYYLYLTGDMRLGTFGHPWERTLCVFGDALLAQVADGITGLLGAPVRVRRPDGEH